MLSHIDASIVAPYNETFNSNTITNSYLQNSEIYNDDGESSSSYQL